MQPWWKRVVRWGQTNMTEDDPKRLDLAFWRAHWRKMRIQGVIVNASGIVSYYPSESPLQYRAQALGDRDLFGDFVAAAREEGLAVIARMDVNRCTEDFYRAHPDWFCVDAQGAPITSQGRYYSCVNGGYYDRFIPDTLREIIRRYRPDGFTDNSWSGTGRKLICYCDHCKRQFKQATGLALPARADWDAPGYAQWVRWGMQRRTQIWDLFNRVTREAGGEDCLWSGMLHADPASGCDSLRDLKALCARAKFIFTDHQGRDELNGFEQNSLNGSLLRMASGDENTLTPESIAHYVRGERTFRLAANPAAESQTWLIDGIAGGISPWYHHIGGSTRDARQFRSTADVFAWHEQNQDALYDRVDLARVGLVWDQHNAAFYGREKRAQRVSQPWRGVHHALTRARIPFLPVNAQDIARDADRLDALVLPGLAILREEAREAVLAHIARGGGLVLTGVTDTLDQDGAPAIGPLWDALGLRPTGKRFGPEPGVGASWEHYEAHNYFLLPPGERHAVLEGFADTSILPIGGLVTGIESTGPLAPIAGYIPAFPIYPPEFSWIREQQPQVGTLFAGTLPGGARVVCLAADIDRACGEQLLPDHAQLLANAVRWVGKEQPLSVEGPGYLDCKLYRQGDRTLLHIVNLSGLNRRGYVEEVLPVGPIAVRMPFFGKGGATAQLRVAGGQAQVTLRDATAQIALPRIGAHELIVLS